MEIGRRHAQPILRLQDMGTEGTAEEFSPCALVRSYTTVQHRAGGRAFSRSAVAVVYSGPATFMECISYQESLMVSS